MGSNMQRQSVPIMMPESPIVGTGLESKVARDSRSAIVSPVVGVIESVDAERILIRSSEVPDELALTEYTNIVEIPLKKYQRTNQNTSQNQRPLVYEKQKVKAGEIIADGASCNRGDLALGRNVMVAFMPWRGYNFEDAIVISERFVKDDVFSSIHINEIELEIRDTKRGEEELTFEIPNISEDATRQLDERGIIRIGAKVKQGDILIGKVTPKGETDPTPEEKLLRAIFGEKAGEVKDASKTASPGIRGVVINTKLFEKKKKISKKDLRDAIISYQKEITVKKQALKKERDESCALLHSRECPL